MKRRHQFLIVVLLAGLALGISVVPVGATEDTASAVTDLSEDSDATISSNDCEFVQSIGIECGGGTGGGDDDDDDSGGGGGGGGGTGPAPYP